MAVPSSGSLSMSGLAKEKLYDDYNSTSTPTGPIRMYDLVRGGDTYGSGEIYEPTNTGSASYPDNNAPDAFSEWYGYDHDAPLGGAAATLVLYGRSTGLTYQRRVTLEVAGYSYETEIYNASLNPTCRLLSTTTQFIFAREPITQAAIYSPLQSGMDVTLTVTSLETTSWNLFNTACPTSATGSSSITFTLQGGTNNVAFITDVQASTQNCTAYLIVNNSSTTTVTLSFLECGGSTQQITVFPLNSNLVCVAEGSYPTYISGTTNYQVFSQGACTV